MRRLTPRSARATLPPQLRLHRVRFGLPPKQTQPAGFRSAGFLCTQKGRLTRASRPHDAQGSVRSVKTECPRAPFFYPIIAPLASAFPSSASAS